MHGSCLVPSSHQILPSSPPLTPTQVHEAIRADPSVKAVSRSKPAGESKRWKEPKLTYDQRKDKLKAKLSELAADDE